MKRVLGIAVVAIVVVGAVCVGAGLNVANRKSSEVRDKVVADAERNLPAYLALGAKIDADAYFAAALSTEDAGPWLNPRVAWMPGPGVSGELVLPADLVADITSWGDAWVDHAGDPRLSKLDFSWMAGLAKYGHWNVMPGGPLEKLEHPRFESMPIPNFIHLQTWVKLRLLAAREKGDFAAASAEIRQLARLCHSTEFLIGAMVGINLLKVERRAYDTAVAAKVDVRKWPAPYESEWLEDLRAVEWAGAGYVSVQLPREVYEKARSVKAGRCAGLSEAAIYVLVRKRLDVDVPEWLAAELEKPEPPCRLEVARWYLANGVSPFEGTGPDAPSRTERIGIRLFPETAIGLVESVATPEFFAKLESRSAPN